MSCAVLSAVTVLNFAFSNYMFVLIHLDIAKTKKNAKMVGRNEYNNKICNSNTNTKYTNTYTSFFHHTFSQVTNFHLNNFFPIPKTL